MSEETITETPPVTRPAPHSVPALGPVGFLDAPEHARLRRSVAAAFTARRVERVRERSRRMLAELVDEMLQDGPPADLTEAVLSPFPVAVICELMGVPAADRQGVHTWTQLILSSSHGAEAGEKAKKEMGAYFSELIGLREGSTDEDVTSLLGAAVGRGELTLKEAADLAVLLQLGGEAATGNGGRLFYVLLTRPELAERLRAEPIQVSYPDVSLDLGPHYRPGGTLARLVSELLMDALLDGVPGLRLAVPAEEVPFRKAAHVRGPEALPVTW
ncbi:hypothetical protein MQE23_37745 [Streptomyces sp. HP-A2021]|uniref:hypothetical protein n=1 Tax=Streptomyces sp. HP-A2021 TaxID=2927875 RepID=UPI001FAF8CA4|nr:hypothetical protein [Streptomyces sp. HP-A2021]UOB14453.1 hypothetical protein MQE23_37745 [Streptomyces sp. HP-A2021]